MIGPFGAPTRRSIAVAAAEAAGGVAEVTSERQTRERAPKQWRQTVDNLIALGLDSTGSLPTVASRPPCGPLPVAAPA
jgi:hypothetical protein